jgi:uncharacterized membrane protein
VERLAERIQTVCPDSDPTEPRNSPGKAVLDVEGSRMNPAILFGVGTMLAWGFWITFGNVASNSIDPEMAAFVSYLTATVVTGVYLVFSDASIVVTNRGLLYSAIAGVAAALGVLSTFIGVTVGSTAVVSTIGGMYFVTAAVISVAALGEPLSIQKAAGIGLALVAIVVINQ